LRVGVSGGRGSWGGIGVPPPILPRKGGGVSIQLVAGCVATYSVGTSPLAGEDGRGGGGQRARSLGLSLTRPAADLSPRGRGGDGVWGYPHPCSLPTRGRETCWLGGAPWLPSPLWGGIEGGVGGRRGGWGGIGVPPPGLPRKGGGVSIRLLASWVATVSGRHLPPCGGGWEGGGRRGRSLGLPLTRPAADLSPRGRGGDGVWAVSACLDAWG